MDSHFSIYYHHDGHFANFDREVFYVGGNMKAKHGLDTDRVGFFDLVDEIKGMGYQRLKLFYRVPSASLTNGLKKIKADREVMEMMHNATH